MTAPGDPVRGPRGPGLLGDSVLLLCASWCYLQRGTTTGKPLYAMAPDAERRITGPQDEQRFHAGGRCPEGVAGMTGDRTAAFDEYLARTATTLKGTGWLGTRRPGSLVGRPPAR